MNQQRRIRARRGEPKKLGSSVSPSTMQLPEDVLSEQVRRLSLFCFIAASMWGVALLLDLFVIPTFTGLPRNGRTLVLELFGGITSFLIGLVVSVAGASVQRKADVGVAVMLVNAGSVAAINAWALPIPEELQPMYLSWIAVVILVYSIVAPHTPRKMLVAALIAASLDPLAMWMASLAGVPPQSPMRVLLRTWPNYAFAIIAMLPSRVLHRLGRRIHEEQALGSYYLVELLGRGGMGEVWRAEHQLLARQAAIKLVRPGLLGASSEDDAQTLLRRFEREAQATAALNSPHTIQLYDFGATDDGSFYYVMELLAGRDLESLVREFGPMPFERAIFLLRQVCHSLADAHARGFVHRDIKPANIYVCRMGLEYDFVKVLDFGLVKVKGRASGMESLATVNHATSGTPAYMAPETILGDVDVDRRADVYALGCVAYFLLTGKLVFEADTPMKMLMQHLQVEPVPPSQRTELPVPPEFDALVMACLRKDPDQRPQTARELFDMACNCCTKACWSHASAETWWRAHLPELTTDIAPSAAAKRFSGIAAT